MSIQQLSVWYGRDASALVLTQQIAGQLAVTPRLTAARDIYGGSRVPLVEAIALSYQVACQGAFFGASLNAMDPDHDDAWLFVFDTAAGTGLAVPTKLSDQPKRRARYNQADVVRTTLLFTNPEDDRKPYHVAPGLEGTKQFVVTAAGGYVETDIAEEATSVALAGDPATLTFKGKVGF